MKKLLYVIAALSAVNIMADSAPTTFPDVEETTAPVISLRNLFTGEPLRNGHYGERSEKNTHWMLNDIVVDGQNYVQFRALDTDKCLTIGTATKPCEETEITSFNLIPTDTGAFILQSPIEGSCLFSNNFREYDLAQCTRPSQLSKPVSLPFLWAILPPFGQSHLLTVPGK